VGNVAEGTNFGTSPAVSVEDSNGNVVTSDTGSVTLGINSGPAAGSLTCSNSGFPTISAVSGIATFTNCQITGTAAAGTYTLKATRSGLTTATSGSVVINVGTATQLAFTTQPGGGANGATWSTQPGVTVEDSGGNTVTTSNASITLAINSQPGSGATLTCTTNPLSASSGVASFAGCKITGTAGSSYTLKATASSLTSATSSSFSIAWFVQAVSTNYKTTSSNQTYPISISTTAGDLIVVSVSQYTGSCFTVSDSAGNTYTYKTVVPTGGYCDGIAYILDAASVTSVSIKTANTNTNVAVTIAEFAGYTSVDQSSTGSSSGGGTFSSGSTPTTSNADDLLVGTVGTNSGSFTITSTGYTATTYESNGSANEQLAYQQVTSTGSYSFAGTQTGSYWGAVICAFH
jgi:hypothetical protein